MISLFFTGWLFVELHDIHGEIQDAKVRDLANGLTKDALIVCEDKGGVSAIDFENRNILCIDGTSHRGT